MIIGTSGKDVWRDESVSQHERDTGKEAKHAQTEWIKER